MRKPASRLSSFFARPFFPFLMLSCLCNPAFAQVEVSGSLSNLRYSLTDLNPADGIQPALNVTAWLGVPLASGDIFVGRNAQEDFHQYRATSENIDADRISLSWGKAATADASFGGRQALSTLRGDIALAGTIPAPGRKLLARAESSPAAVYFELGPMSSLTVQLDALLHASATRTGDAEQYGFAAAVLSVGPTTYPGEYESISDAITARTGFYYGETLPLDVDVAGTLTVTLNNDSLTDSKYGFIGMAVNGIVQVDNVSPVPEPAQWAMLLVGACALHNRTRRAVASAMQAK